jgi:hypothetical protein
VVVEPAVPEFTHYVSYIFHLLSPFHGFATVSHILAIATG